MSKNVLVVYATKSGSATDVARFIADTLTKAGVQVAVKPVHAAKNIYAQLLNFNAELS